jgi:hypothetical protein
MERNGIRSLHDERPVEQRVIAKPGTPHPPGLEGVEEAIAGALIGFFWECTGRRITLASIAALRDGEEAL